MGKTLIAYYSRSGENYFAGSIKAIRKGNTEIVAEKIKEVTNGDLFKIEQELPYSDNYNECINQAKQDQMNNARPQLTHYLDSIDVYDTIYVGFPNYWSSMPMAVFTFLENYNFEGKTIKPFVTHEGSGFANSLKDMKKCCPKAIISEGLSIYGSQSQNCLDKVKEWVD